MNTIWKFPIEKIKDEFEISMPQGAQILCVDTQHIAENKKMPFIWAIVSPKAPQEMRKFRMVGTGHPIEETTTKANHVGTFQMHGGALVIHLFVIN